MSIFGINIFEGKCMLPYYEGGTCQCWLPEGHDLDCKEANRQARIEAALVIHHLTDEQLTAIKARVWTQGVADADFEWNRAAEFSMSGRADLTNPYPATPPLTEKGTK